jgi:hypothetical protein
MKVKNKLRGRPKKKVGRIESWRFSRAGMIMSAYDEARKSGEKHSVAITQAVDYVRQRYPKMPISETTVKRIFATFRSRKGQTENILWFKRFTVGKKKLARLRSMLKQVPDTQGVNGRSVPVPSIQNLTKSLTAFKFRYAERPRYSRHNRKIPKK